ncbi:MAG: VCBS repeat-containing protein, partial [Minisyncoccales bacterium]
MKTTKLFKVLFITFFSIYFLKYAPVYADTNIKTLDLTAKTTVKDPYCKGVVYSFNLPAGGVNFRGMSGYVSMTPTEPIFTQTLIWAANLPNGDCPPSGSLLNREDGSTIYPQTDGAPWFAAYILKNSENKYVRLNTDFMLPKPIPMKGCVIVIVGGCGAVATEITSESHMKMLYDTEPFDKLSKPSLVPLSYEYGYGGGGGASGGANCSGSQCAFASVWKADKDYDLHFFHGGVAGGGFSPVADPPQGNWDADFDYYLYKNCDNLKQGINGPSDYYREIPADATPLFNLRQNVINNAPQTSIKDKISGFGGQGDLPVVGDWNGDGKTEIGNYKGNGVWVLDYDGSYVWDGASVDKIFSFGSSTDKPITGDWNGDGKTEIGNYKGNGMFALDQNGNGAWDGASVDK